MRKNEENKLTLCLKPSIMFNRSDGVLEVERIFDDGITIYNLNVEGEIKKGLIEMGWTPPTDPAPELVKGEWAVFDLASAGLEVCANYEKPTLVCLIRDCGGMAYHWKAIEINGKVFDFNKKALTPHTFTESDLKLLDTDEVKYIVETIGNEYYIRGMNKKFNVFLTKTYPTKHLAIKSAFDMVTKVNYADKELGLL